MFDPKPRVNIGVFNASIRICRTLYQLKTPKELYAVGKSECPDLDHGMLQKIIVAHYPMGQNKKVNTENEDEKKNLNEIVPPSMTKRPEDPVKVGAISSKGEAISLEKELQLSDSDSDSSLLLMYTLSEED